MEFLGFGCLAVISAVVSLILFYVLKIKLPGGYTTSLIVGYLGAWVGTPVLGKWEFLAFHNISIIPGVLGAVAAILLARACVECCKK